MANILKIKRGTGSSAPSSLRRGELAYAEGSKALYIGSGDETNNAAANLHIIGGALNNMVAPTGSLNMSSQKIINLAAPVSPNDAARKVDLDNAIQGLDVRDSVRAATTGNITIATALNNGDTIDGVTLATNDRVLVKNQSSIAENGVYVVGTSPARAADLNAAGDVSSGMFFFVEEGTVNDNTGWVCKTPDTNATPPTLTTMEFIQFSGTGLITAGAGLTKTGNTLSATTEAIADGGANLATADQIHTFVTGSYAGDITAVSAGTGLAGGGTTGTVNLSVDLEELANGASDPVGNDKVVYVTAGGDTKKYAFSDVPLTIFDSATFIKDSSIIDCGTF
jgi:hypothetical protein